MNRLLKMTKAKTKKSKQLKPSSDLKKEKETPEDVMVFIH